MWAEELNYKNKRESENRLLFEPITPEYKKTGKNSKDKLIMGVERQLNQIEYFARLDVERHRAEMNVTNDRLIFEYLVLEISNYYRIYFELALGNGGKLIITKGGKKIQRLNLTGTEIIKMLKKLFGGK
jgi:hypothetical protein